MSAVHAFKRLDEPTTPRQRVLALVAGGVTHRSVAVQAGVKLKALVAWLDDHDEMADGGAVHSRIAAWLEDLDHPHQREQGGPGLVDTPTSKKIEVALEYARTKRGMAIVCGGPGSGKSSTAKRYMGSRQLGQLETAERRHAAMRYHATEDSGKRGVFYVEATAFERSPSAIVAMIADALGVDTTTFSHRIDTLARRIIEFLRPGDLLIVDEAQHMDPAALDGVRSFHDRAGIGLVLMGNETVYSSMTKRTRRAEFAQLYSRVGYVVHVPSPEEADIDAVLESWSVRGRRERDMAQQVASGPGGLRSLAKMLGHARLLASVAKRPLDADLMQSALENMPQGQ